MISPVAPALTGNGLAMRAGLFLDALSRVADVDLVVAPLFGGPRDDALAWARRRAAIRVLDLRSATDTHFSLLMRLGDDAARLDAFCRFGRPSLAARVSMKAAGQLDDLVATKRYDVVHTSRSYCAPFALSLVRAMPQPERPVLTLDLDEDDARVFAGLARLADERGRDDERRWQLAEADAFRRLVADSVPAFDRVWIASAQDAARLAGGAGRALAILANAVDVPYPAPRRDDGRTLLFVGSLAYAPNEDAIYWFIKEVWPTLSRVRGLRLRIVGAGASGRLRRLAARPGIELLGRVDDLRRCYAGATATIVPIRVGGGTRIKILESAGYGVPVVATSLGAEGLGLEAGQSGWLADGATAFARAVLQAVTRGHERRRRAQRARAHVMRHFRRQDKVAQLARQFATMVSPVARGD